VAFPHIRSKYVPIFQQEEEMIGRGWKTAEIRKKIQKDIYQKKCNTF